MEETLSKLQAQFSDAILETKEFRGETSVSVKAETAHAVAKFLRDQLGFDYLIDLATVDHFETEPRWEVVYELYSMAAGTHLRLKYRLP